MLARAAHGRGGVLSSRGSRIHGQGQTADRFRGPARVEYQRSRLTFFRKTRSPMTYALESIVLVVKL